MSQTTADRAEQLGERFAAEQALGAIAAPPDSFVMGQIRVVADEEER